MSIEFIGIELTPAALCHTMLQSCTLIIDGADASRPRHQCCGCHPPAARRSAPSIMRIQLTDSAANKFALRPHLISNTVMCLN